MTIGTRNIKPGRPPKFVPDANGKPIVGLSFNKTNKSFYATYSDPRVYFGSDFPTALLEFRKYENSQADEEPCVEIHLPSPPAFAGTQIIKWDDLSKDPPVVGAAYAGDTLSIPETLFLETARTMILRDPIDAARKLGIPEISRLKDLPKLEPPLTLASILQFYLNRRKPSKEEAKKAKASWRKFCRVVKVTTIREITSDMVHDYCDAITAELEKNNWSKYWLKGRFTRVKTVLNYSLKKGRNNKDELTRVLGFCKCLTVEVPNEESAKPIEREHFHTLLNHCSDKWRAIILLALNCGYYGKDIQDLKTSMILNKDGLDYIVFPREKTKHKRINVLWKETKQALDKYLSTKKEPTDYVFCSQFGTPLPAHDVQRCFDRLKKRTGVPNHVKFSHFRDGAASALFGKVVSDLLSVTIGHRIKGEKSKYICVKPEQVKICADIIHDEYFGELSNGKEARIHLAAS